MASEASRTTDASVEVDNSLRRLLKRFGDAIHNLLVVVEGKNRLRLPACVNELDTVDHDLRTTVWCGNWSDHQDPLAKAPEDRPPCFIHSVRREQNTPPDVEDFDDHVRVQIRSFQIDDIGVLAWGTRPECLPMPGIRNANDHPDSALGVLANRHDAWLRWSLLVHSLFPLVRSEPGDVSPPRPDQSPELIVPLKLVLHSMGNPRTTVTRWRNGPRRQRGLTRAELWNLHTE
ncbi:MAG: hypothetical protein SGI84_01210 [Gemmatimonadota bacterium]|nr:hypothetical protein [Gemmatimonadota bacterium]